MIGSDGRFGRYADMRDGVGANLRQLLLYQDRDGLRSVSSMVNRWAPPSENDTGAYVQRVAAAMGVDPNAPVNLRDPQLATSMIAAMAQHENGRPINPRVIREGVNRALGRNDEDGLPIIPGSNQPTVADRRPQLPTELLPPLREDTTAKPAPGSTHAITVDFNNVPQGANVRLDSQGEGAEIASLNIRRAMPHINVGQ